MNKFMITVVAVAGIAAAVPACACCGQTEPADSSRSSYENFSHQNYGGWLTALLRGETSHVTARNGQVNKATDQRATTESIQHLANGQGQERSGGRT